MHGATIAGTKESTRKAVDFTSCFWRYARKRNNMSTESERLYWATIDYSPMWVVYASPKDYPSKFVVRVWYGETPGSIIAVCEKVSQAREAITEQGGSKCLGRFEDDEPVIVEVWI